MHHLLGVPKHLWFLGSRKGIDFDYSKDAYASNHFYNSRTFIMYKLTSLWFSNDKVHREYIYISNKSLFDAWSKTIKSTITLSDSMLQ